MQLTDEYEVVGIISRLNDYKSLDYLDIPITLIQETKFNAAPYIDYSFNDCLVKGAYPDILKIAKVASLRKGGFKAY